MIKIWILMTMVSSPNWHSVKTISEIYFEKQLCESRQIVAENRASTIALEMGLNPIFVDSWCIESEMFVPYQT
mgnify:FL=1